MDVNPPSVHCDAPPWTLFSFLPSNSYLFVKSQASLKSLSHNCVVFSFPVHSHSAKPRQSQSLLYTKSCEQWTTWTWYQLHGLYSQAGKKGFKQMERINKILKVFKVPSRREEWVQKWRVTESNLEGSEGKSSDGHQIYSVMGSSKDRKHLKNVQKCAKQRGARCADTP